MKKYMFCGFNVQDTSIEKKQFGNDELEVFKFSGYASTFDVDLTNDKIMPGAFSDVQPVKVLWGHDMHSPAIGMLSAAHEDEAGLFISADLPMDDRRVREEIVPQMRLGSINSMSIGFFPHNVRIDGNLRKIGRVELVEVSLVNFPANPEARVTALKQINQFLNGIEQRTVVSWDELPKTLATRDRMWDSDQAVSRWRAASNSEEEPSATYRDNFLWYDQADRDNFGAYKLPIGDIIGGRHVAVPRAIFAARAAMAGARGGVDIPDSDRPGVERNINRYYELMSLEPPFTSERSLWTEPEVRNLPRPELVHVLKSGKISHNAARYISSLIFAEQSQAVDSGNHIGELTKTIQTLNQSLRG